ncbi:MAG TPA: ABC transporter substrate-binding protein [Chloroflexota bacterium]|nr:ABC transporter substrate-binding protein [Chloroflexota bacterium]
MTGTRWIGITILGALLVACSAPSTSPPAASPAGASGAPAAAAAAPPVAAAPPTASASPSPQRVALKWGLNTTTINVAPLWVAKEQGIFAKQGIDVELVTLPADLLVASLISGELGMSSLGSTPLVNATLGGADLAFFGSIENLLRFWLYARPDIAAVTDLRGKQVAITSRGGVVKRATELTLERNGMNPEGDATLVATGNLNNSLTALLGGSVAAAMLAPPVTFRAQDEGMRLLVDTADYHYPAILGGIAASRAWVARNEDVARRGLQAVAEGVAFASRQKERTKEIIAQYTQNDDPQLLERSYSAQQPVWERTLIVPPDGIRLELEAVAQDNPAARGARPEQFYDNHLAEELERSGFIQRLWE